MDDSLAILRREAALKGLVPLFFLSGATSLVYETLWGRSLHLVFGTSQVAIGTVLAAFMGGLALGGFLMARHADRVRRPLRLYGLLEAGIGLYALVFPVLLSALTPLYHRFWNWLEPPFVAFAALQALLVGLLLLIPTTCMGATLPLLARFATTRISRTGHRVGLLYGTNTAGAVFGTFLAGFVLLPRLGLTHTTWIAVAGNLLLAGGAILLARGAEQREAPLPVEGRRREPAPLEHRPLLWIAGLAGFSALVYELAWFRLMALTLGGSTYAFSLMLLAFLVGLAAGGWGGGRFADRWLDRGGRVGTLLGLWGVQITIGVVSYGLMWIYGELPYLYVRLYTVVRSAPELFWPAQLILACGIMLPATLFMGATFPLVVRSLVSDPDRLGGPVGRVYGFNTLGGIFGALAAAFVLLPGLHVRGTVLLAVGVNVLTGSVALLAAWRHAPALRPRLRWALAVPMVLYGVALLRPPPWNPLLMTAGMYKYVVELSAPTRQKVWEYAVEGYELLFYDEGLSSVVTVARTTSSGNIWLANNGKVDASTTVDMPTQVLVGHFPFLFGRDPDRVGVIGLASGVTAGATVLYPEMERLDILELEPAIFEASHFFDEHNHRPLEDPRTVAIANDARNHLLLTPSDTYDIIISEPSNPWLSGVANLFTLEFFQTGRDRLKPGGIFSQWVQMYGMGAEELRALLRTFATVFPHVAVFATIEDADLVILGSTEPLEPDIREFERVLDTHPEVRADLERVKIEGAFDLLTHYQADHDSVMEITAGAPLNTDDNMLIEYEAPRRLYESTSTMNYLVLLSESVVPTDALHTREDFLALARAYGRHEEWVKALLVLKDGVGRFPDDEDIKALGRAYQRRFRQQMSELEQEEAPSPEGEGP